MSTDRTFSNYMKVSRGSQNFGRYDRSEEVTAHHNLSNKSFIQRYGNSYIVSLPRRKLRLIIGPHWLGIIVTVFCICFGTWLNLRSLNKHVDFSENTIYMFKVFMTTFFILTHVLLVLTATTDPGIVFSNCDSHYGEQDEFNLEGASYCEICQVQQPETMKIHHCTECNYCIEGMDHHCPWMVSI
jgi:hypothetical protein